MAATKLEPGLPPLPLDGWRETYATLHRWTQVVGKVQLALTPRENHFWNVGFRLTPRGLTTGAIGYRDRLFSFEFDFVDHRLLLAVSDGTEHALALRPMSVATFYRKTFELLDWIGVRVRINENPVEIASEAIPFSHDERHAAYDPDPVHRCFRALAFSARVMEEFRARFIGKSSPVLFWWGSFDLSTSRYSGRRAPERPGADAITREAYSHEVSSAGWWPGDDRFPEPAYFAYTAPKPEGLETAEVLPPAAFWSEALGEHLLPYEVVRSTPDPRATLLDFMQSCYDAGADLGGWDRAALERDVGGPEPTVERRTRPPAHPPPA